MFKDTEGHETQYCESCLELQKKLEAKEQELEPFKDDYFKNLDTKTIAELAKKSIRLTTENRKFEDALDEIEEILKTIIETNRVYPLQANLQKVLKIINKAKGGVNGNT